MAQRIKSKSEREKEVLFGLIEAFLETGKPIGSNSLREAGFEHLSSATIRNYFSKLEAEGLLEQQHSSGGRIPTEKGFRLYAVEASDKNEIDAESLQKIENIRKIETKEVSLIIREALEALSSLTHLPAFISSPKFDQDFVSDIRVLPIDQTRTLVALLTDFGSIQTEILSTARKLSNFSAKRIESYLHYRLTGQGKPQEITTEEEAIASRFYNESMLRFFVGYTHFTNEEVSRTGLSALLHYPEFQDPAKLAEALSLFENETSLRHVSRDTISHKELRFWIGQDLTLFGSKSKETSIIAAPYFINRQAVGAFGILGPIRIPYRPVFGIMKAMSQALSHTITNNLYKFKLSYRQPAETQISRIGHHPIPLIEHKKGSI